MLIRYIIDVKCIVFHTQMLQQHQPSASTLLEYRRRETGIVRKHLRQQPILGSDKNRENV